MTAQKGVSVCLRCISPRLKKYRVLIVLINGYIILLLCRYSYMIDNIILLITGILHQRPINELIPKCHPLGSFEQMEAIHIASTPAELYNAVLVDTPIGKANQMHLDAKSELLMYFFKTLIYWHEKQYTKLNAWLVIKWKKCNYLSSEWRNIVTIIVCEIIYL